MRKPGDTFKAYGRQFVIESLECNGNGVWVRREPLDPPGKGEPEAGEKGFFFWQELALYGS